MPVFSVLFVIDAGQCKRVRVTANTHLGAVDAAEQRAAELHGWCMPDESGAIVSGKGERRGYVNPYGYWEREDDILADYA